MQKFNKYILGIALLKMAVFAGVAFAAAPTSSSSSLHIGIVDFRKCVEKSKIGQNEQEQFDNTRKQLEAVLVEKEKKLAELTTKFNDPNYIDSLSPEAEEAAKKEYRALGQEFSQTQSQYYQMLNQTNVKVIQKLADVISQAAASVSKEKSLDLVLNSDSTFFFEDALNITSDVVKAMDDIYAKQPKQETAPATPAPAAKPIAPAIPATK